MSRASVVLCLGGKVFVMNSVRVALIGCGGFAGVHARRLKEVVGCEVVGLVDVDASRMENFAREHFSDVDAPHLFDSTNALYGGCECDAVVICTPHSLHFNQGMQALEEGRHVLMEKPMVVGSAEARALSAKVRDSGLVFVVGYNTPCTDVLQRAREIVRSGELGELQTISGWLSQDWQRLTVGTWRQQRELSGGGQMLDSGAHLFASIAFCVEQNVESAYACTDGRGCEVEINGASTVRFEGGVLANVLIAGDSACDGAGLVLFFGHGRIELDGWGGSWMRVYRRGTNNVEEFESSTRRTPDENFFRSIIGSEQPIAGVELGERLAILMDVLYRSAESGVPEAP